MARVTANPIRVLKQILGEGPAWLLHTHLNTWLSLTMNYRDRDSRADKPGTCALYTNTWPDLTSHVRRQQEGCHSSSLVCLHFHVVQLCKIGLIQTPPRVGPRASLFLALLCPDNPYHCSIYVLLKLLFRSLSLLPHLCIQTPPVSTHLSNILALVQKMRAHACHLQGYSSVQHLLSYCQATHLPHQHPSSSSVASHFEGDVKSYQMTHKMV